MGKLEKKTLLRRSMEFVLSLEERLGLEIEDTESIKKPNL